MCQHCNIMVKIPSNKWTTIRLENELKTQAEKLILSPKYKKMGFTSVSALLSYLIRREIDYYK